MRALLLLTLGGLLCVVLARDIKESAANELDQTQYEMEEIILSRNLREENPKNKSKRKKVRNSPVKDKKKNPNKRVQKSPQRKVDGSKKKLKRKTPVKQLNSNKYKDKEETIAKINKINNAKGYDSFPETRQDDEIDACSANGTVSESCIMTALSVLEFEKNQIQNFKKRKDRMKSQDKLMGNKNDKRESFFSAASMVLQALGGNMTSPKCGSSNESRSTSREQKDAVDAYGYLMNCSRDIEADCGDTGYHPDNTTFYEECDKLFEWIKDNSTDCRLNKKDDAQAACACWTKTDEYVQTARQMNCIKPSTDQAKAINIQKRKCVNTFAACKKKEDASVALVQVCMAGDIISESAAEEGKMDLEDPESKFLAMAFLHK